MTQFQAYIKKLLSWPPLFYLIVFFLLPTLIMVVAAFQYPSDYGGLVPIYSWKNSHFVWHLTIENFQYLFTESLYIQLFFKSACIALLTTFLCIVFAYPLSWTIARSSKKYRNLLLLLVILPFWSSFLVRIYAWVIILGPQSGFTYAINWFLGIFALEPVQMRFGLFAVMIAMVYVHLPFMILPLYANLEKHDLQLLDAAQDLGANHYQRFWQITFPLSLSGLLAGSTLVFIPALGMFVIPEILGGTESMMIGNLIKQQILETQDWPFGSALSIMLTIGILLILGIVTMIANWKKVRLTLCNFKKRFCQSSLTKGL